MLEMLKQFDLNDIVVRAEGLKVRRRQLAVMVADAAHKLRLAGLDPGDRVLLFLPNSLELLVYYYACLADGLISVPVNVRQAPEEIRSICRDSVPALAVCSEMSRAALPERLQIRILVADRIVEPGVPPGAAQFPQWPGHHPAALFYTSGSTGAPKGVLYSHATLRNNSQMCREHYRLTPEDRSVLCHCMAHNFVFSQLCVPLLDAGGCVDITGFGDVAQTAEAIKDGASILKLIPWFAMNLFRYCEEQHIRPPRLRLIMVGGDRVPDDVFEHGRRVMGVGISQNIGMTETNTYSTDLAGSDMSKQGSLGLPLPGVEIDIRDENGASCSQGVKGQIWVRSPANMVAYWRNETATRKTLVNGWVATGDSGHFDGDRVLWFDSRIRHIIIRDGDNIYPAEVERAIARHPAVERVAVVGIPDPAHGESVAAVVVSKPGAELDFSALKDFLAPLISPSKIPGDWLRSERLPLGHNGKVDYAELQKRVTASLRTPASPADA